MQKKRTFSQEELIQFPLAFPKGKKIGLRGDLGAGKTTLIRAILEKYFKKNIEVRSPTYTYYQELGPQIFHFDCYRIEDPEIFLQIGGKEVCEDPKNTCFIEWAENLGEEISLDGEINILPNEDPNLRDYELSGSLAWEDGRSS